MINLGQIEQEINQSSSNRQAFRTDPVRFLRSRGITLSQDQEHAIRQSISAIPPIYFEYGGLRAAGLTSGVGQRGQIRFVTFYQA